MLQTKMHNTATLILLKGYQVLLLDSPIVSHLIQKLEADNENVTFARVDADHIDKLIQKKKKRFRNYRMTKKRN